ncbi:MAG TPA: hypothetical protein VIF64_00500, partial [Pyrinomonadaceae bacterium]
MVSSVVLVPSVLLAQEKQYTENKVDQAVRSEARIDPSTLGMSLEIPLAGAPGRAGTSLSSVVRYSSKQWRLKYSGGVQGPINYFTWTRPKFSENSMAGWTSSLDAPWIEYTGREQRFDENGGPMSDNPQDPYNGEVCFIPRIHLHLPDGSSSELRKSDTPQCFIITNPQPDFTGTFYSTDGSRVRFDADSGVLYLPDGGRYLFGAEQTVPRYNTEQVTGRWATQSIDRNGNTINYSFTSVTDTLGRTYANPLAANPSVGNQIYNVPGVGGQLSYTLVWDNLANALSNPSDPLRYTSNLKCVPPNVYQSVSPSLYSSANLTKVCADDSVFNPVVLRQVILPNNRSYQFKYNVFGEIDKIIYPTGGYERFLYDSIAPISSNRVPYAQANRGVVERWVSASGDGTDEAHWQYSAGGLPYMTSITAPNGTLTERLLYGGGIGGGNAEFGFDNPLGGMAYEERTKDASSQMLRRSLTEWQVSGPQPGGYSAATRDPRVIKNISLILDTGGNALAAASTTQYDADLNAISTSAYDYASVDATTAQTGAIGSIPSGTLVRTEEVTYLVNDTSISSSVRQTYRDRQLLGLPSSRRVKNAGGSIVAQTSISYDEGGPFGLLNDYGSVSNWTDPQTAYRGNPTTTSHWSNFNGSTIFTFPNGTYLTTHAQYDQCGSVRKAWDARDTGLTNPSQISYLDAFSDGVPRNTYAFPASASTEVPDSTGTYGSNLALTTTNIYDFNTGKIISTTDPNGKTTSYDYTDPLNRLKQITLPDTGRVRYNYFDTPGDLYIQVLMDEDSSRSIENRRYFDGLGRPIRGFLFDGTPSTPWSATDTYYDNMGRVAQVSNPFRVSSPSAAVPAPCSACTTTGYDALGRVLTVTTLDNAQVTTSYGALTSGGILGTTVLVTDQAGNKRRSLTDSLGRLVRVDEPDVNGNLGDVSSPVQPTSYAYDVLGNLRQVTQGTQQRFFMYDSLSRLIRARNPEQAVNANLNLSDAVSGNSQWCMAYTYDANGNLVTRIDARNTTSYAYDALNRNTTVNYSDTATTPDTTRIYDSATNGKGRLRESYGGGNETVGANVEHVKILGYDALGRPLEQRQRFKTNSTWSGEYQTSRAYNLAGGVTSQIYPSGNTVTYNYDAAGRLGDKDAQNVAFTGNLGDGGAPRTYSAGILYSPFGGISKERFGTDTPIYNKQFYNVRGQLAEIRVGTYSTDDTWWNRGAILNVYSGLASWTESREDNNGNLRKQMIYIPNDDQITSSVSSTFFYDYDTLNRLDVAREVLAGQNSWVQDYDYDRYGNRTINQTNTWGAGINSKQFTVNTADNRLGVPAGQTGTMTYDDAGNLTTDTYSGAAVTRSYDAENRITSETQANSYGAGSYSYNADGQRVRRNVNGVETWQVFGISGELLAEYAASAAPANPQKEYGYRNGQLLIIAETTGSSGSSYAGTPYSGAPAAIPGTIQAEDFDNGGEGVAYHDTSPANYGYAYRSTDVDLAASDDPQGGGYYIGWTYAGEWQKYTVNVATT